MGLKYRRRRDDLSGGDHVDQGRGLNRIKLDLLRFELPNQFLAFGLNDGADHLVACLPNTNTHLSLELRVQQPFEIFRHYLFGHKFFVVGKADIGFSGQCPVYKPLPGRLLALFWVSIEIR